MHCTTSLQSFSIGIEYSSCEMSSAAREAGKETGLASVVDSEGASDGSTETEAAAGTAFEGTEELKEAVALLFLPPMMGQAAIA